MGDKRGRQLERAAGFLGFSICFLSLQIYLRRSDSGSSTKKPAAAISVRWSFDCRITVGCVSIDRSIALHRFELESRSSKRVRLEGERRECVGNSVATTKCGEMRCGVWNQHWSTASDRTHTVSDLRGKHDNLVLEFLFLCFASVLLLWLWVPFFIWDGIVEQSSLNSKVFSKINSYRRL